MRVGVSVECTICRRRKGAAWAIRSGRAEFVRPGLPGVRRRAEARMLVAGRDGSGFRLSDLPQRNEGRGGKVMTGLLLALGWGVVIMLLHWGGVR